MDDWIARQSILIKVARDKQLLLNIQYIFTSSSHHLLVEATSTRVISSTRQDELHLYYRRSGQRQAFLNPYPQPATFQLRPGPNITFDNRPAERTGDGVQSPLGWIRRILRQLGAL
jgi:hypothetical protein